MAKRSANIIEFIEAYCRVPEGALVGQPIKLAPFQKKFIRAVYDNKHITRRAYLSMARKNAKTATIACLVLVHIVGPEAMAIENAQIISGARSRDQAALVFKLAEKMVNMSDKLSAAIRIVPSQKMLIGLACNVEYRAISAEGKTAHGLSPVLAILDEVGQIRGQTDAFVDAITTAQGAHENPLLIAISTQAPTSNDLFSIWLDDAANSKDPRIVSHVYAADKDADVMNEKAWYASNPALGLFRSIDDLREQAKQAARMPSVESSFRNLCLNQRVVAESLFVSRSVWESCGDEPELFNETDLVWCGLDLSKRTDLTAFVMAQRHGDVWMIKPYFWTPSVGLVDRSTRDKVPYDIWAASGVLRTTPGATVDYEYVVSEIVELLESFKIGGIAFDRWRIDDFKKELSRVGVDLPMIEIGQGFKDMTPSLEALEEALLNKRMSHGMHPVLTMCAANASVTSDPAGGRKLDKSKTTGRIDGMVALAMAVGIAGRVEEIDTSSVYESRGVVVL